MPNSASFVFQHLFKNCIIWTRLILAEINRTNLFITASAIAFALFIALIPFLLIISGLSTLIGGAEFTNFIFKNLTTILPDHVFKTIWPEIEILLKQDASQHLIAIGTFGMFIAVTGAISTLRHGFNKCYKRQELRPIWKTRIQSLVLVILALFLLSLISILGLTIPFIFNLLNNIGFNLVAPSYIIHGFDFIIIYAALTILLLMLHWYLPCHQPRLTSLLPGICFTLLTNYIVSKLFWFYLSHFDYYTITYAGLAGVMAMLVYLEILAISLLLGALVNKKMNLKLA